MPIFSKGSFRYRHIHICVSNPVGPEKKRALASGWDTKGLRSPAEPAIGITQGVRRIPPSRPISAGISQPVRRSFCIFRHKSSMPAHFISGPRPGEEKNCWSLFHSQCPLNCILIGKSIKMRYASPVTVELDKLCR